MHKHIYPLNEFANAIVAAKKAIKEHLSDDRVIRRFYILPYRFEKYENIAIPHTDKLNLVRPGWKLQTGMQHPQHEEKYKEHPDASHLSTGNIVLQIQLSVLGPHLCLVLTITDVMGNTLSRAYAIDYSSPSNQTNLCKEVYWDIQELGVMDEVIESLEASLGNNENYYVKP